MLIDIGVLVLCGQLLEPLWGALEFLVNSFFSKITLLNTDTLGYSRENLHSSTDGMLEFHVRAG